jgi:hypothetical protein
MRSDKGQVGTYCYNTQGLKTEDVLKIIDYMPSCHGKLIRYIVQAPIPDSNSYSESDPVS